MQVAERETVVPESTKVLGIAETIAAAMAFPMDHVVRRYAKDHGLPLEVAKEHEVELKKYLALCALHPGGGYGMSRVIDELWHTFIWFTGDYHRFCNKVAGRYLHHQPATEEDLVNGKNLEDYSRTLSDYRSYFGEPSVHLWPVPTVAKTDESSCNRCHLGPSCGAKCKSCNDKGGLESMAETTCGSGCTACGGTGCSGSGCSACRG